MSSSTLPRHARVVIVGGGIAGCSVAYHLALMGCTDVLLLECSWGTGDLVPGVPHLNAAAAGEMARRAEARRLVLVHGYPDVDKDAAVAEAQAVFGGPVEWAREGQPVHA